jgi:hypothetical protein
MGEEPVRDLRYGDVLGRIRGLLCVRRRVCKLLAGWWLAERFGEIRADFPRCVQRICLI